MEILSEGLGTESTTFIPGNGVGKGECYGRGGGVGWEEGTERESGFGFLTQQFVHLSARQIQLFS